MVSDSACPISHVTIDEKIVRTGPCATQPTSCQIQSASGPHLGSLQHYWPLFQAYLMSNDIKILGELDCFKSALVLCSRDWAFS